MPPALRFLCALLAATCPAAAETGKAPGAPGDAGSAAEIRQTTLPNPVSDPLVLANRLLLIPVPKDGLLAELSGVIEVRHRGTGLGYAWDPVECRVLFLWRGDPRSGLLAVAEGPSPLGATVGAFGSPRYFGCRLVGGAPEFLYHLGRLAIEERVEISPDGSQLTQHWKVHQADFDLMLAVPERWKAFVKPSSGTWSEGYYRVPKADAADLALTWTLAAAPPLPALPPHWPAPGAPAPASSPAAPDKAPPAAAASAPPPQPKSDPP